ncbi:MAG TPA: hypothetical protein VEX68_15820 [Bryobacteraceae bacterium]|nr:hypothetical protein [Bryobacteraceae bacterium]
MPRAIPEHDRFLQPRNTTVGDELIARIDKTNRVGATAQSVSIAW